MLELKVVLKDEYDEENNQFVTETRELLLEHSLVSLSKWEAKYEKPFIGNDSLTSEELADYIMFMNRGEEPLDIHTLNKLGQDELSLISKYIESKQSATWFSSPDTNQGMGERQVVTSEIIYYWMISYRIPIECEQWHLNRLITLIRVFGEQNKPKEKMSPQQQAEMYRDLNAKRKRELKTSG